MKIVIANWKANPQTEEEALSLAMSVESSLDGVSGVESVICPPLVYLGAVRSVLRNSQMGAQDMSSFAAGAHTGAVTARQIRDMGASHVILNHSEISAGGQDLNEKMRVCASHNLVPILCLGSGAGPGDTEEQLKKNIRQQFNKALDGVNIIKSLFVYEPSWAISTSSSHRTPDKTHVQEMVDFIFSLISASQIEESYVLYGGSVNSRSVKDYLVADGFLVGQASLDATDYSELIKILQNARQ